MSKWNIQAFGKPAIAIIQVKFLQAKPQPRLSLAQLSPLVYSFIIEGHIHTKYNLFSDKWSFGVDNLYEKKSMVWLQTR